MENRELINGILDLTAENERLKQELEKRVEYCYKEPNEKENNQDKDKKMIQLLKRITIEDIFYSWKLKDSIACAASVRDENDEKIIKYKVETLTIEQWFNRIDIDYINNKNTVLAYCGIKDLKEFLKDELLEYYNTYAKEEIDAAKEEAESKTLQLQQANKEGSK